jgi:prepilin peptidase CpaA
MFAHSITLLLFPTIMAFAASSDILTMTISNRFSLILAGGFFALAFLNGMSWMEILMHASAGVIVLIAFFICFTRGWVGGGDAKLAAATALWFGFSHLLDYLLIASLFGGALTILLLLLRGFPLPSWLQDQEWAKRLHDKKSRIPYGVALAAGALFIYPETIWMKAVSM